MGELVVMVGSGQAEYLKTMFPPGTVITPGDTKLIWDRDRREEVDNARATFDRLTGKGYIAFRAEGEKGDKGARMLTFDPEAGRIILVPKMQGGR